MMLLGGALSPLLWFEGNRNWFNEQLRRAGIGWFGSSPWMILAAVAVVSVASAIIMGDRHKRRLQPFRDAEVSLDVPHALFLRPYFTDTGVQLVNHSAWSAGLSLDAYPLNPEQFVGRVLEPYLDVREVGGSPSTIGNARIVVPYDEWQGAVKAAIHAASVIVVLPLMMPDHDTDTMRGEATIWELRYLAESGLLLQTIVLMPHVVWGARRRTREAWERTRVRVADFGLELPAYAEEGGALVFSDADGAWRMKQRFAPEVPARKRVAAGLIEALQWISERSGFSLMQR